MATATIEKETKSDPDTETNETSSEKHGFDEVSGKYPWNNKEFIQLKKLDDEVTQVIEGTLIPQTREYALRLVNIRFGCVYTYLPEHLQQDNEIRQIAGEKSSGKALERQDELKVRSATVATQISIEIFSGSAILDRNSVNRTRLSEIMFQHFGSCTPDQRKAVGESFCENWQPLFDGDDETLFHQVLSWLTGPDDATRDY